LKVVDADQVRYGRGFDAEHAREHHELSACQGSGYSFAFSGRDD